MSDEQNPAPPLEPIHRFEGSASVELSVEAGSFFTLSLPELASAGYLWRVDAIPPCARLVNIPRPRAAPRPEDVLDLPVGGAGRRELRFMVAGAGEGAIELSLRRPWIGGSDTPAQSVSVRLSARAPDLATLPSAPVGSRAAEIPRSAFSKMALLAGSGQWSAYAEAARAAGSWLPAQAPEADSALGRGWGVWDPVREAASRPWALPDDVLESARAALGPKEFASMAHELLDREVQEPSPQAGEGSFLRALLRAGADPLGLAPGAGYCPAARAVELADFRSLRTMLEHGLDPNARAPTPSGPAPLILLALTKDRAVPMSDKMACARALSEAGASLPGAFADRPGPTSMLETLMAAEGLLDPSLGEAPLYGRHYPFSFNYFEESGIGPSELLPAPADQAGRERVLRLLAEPPGEDEDMDPRAPVRGDVWRLRGRTHPWLGAAIEALELGAAARPTPPRGPARSL